MSHLAAKLNIPQPTVSHHLKILRSADFVDYRKMCRDVFYWKNSEKLDRLCHSLSESLKFELREPNKQIPKTDARIEEQYPSL